jgi:TRAP-type C4-dicarboxylate transport system permease small subunit
MGAWRSIIANICGWLAALCAAGMMVVTVADVGLRWFANYPIRGTTEIVELLLACTFFLALPATFLRDENIVVDVIDRWVGDGGVSILKRISAGLAVVVLGILSWQGWIAAQDTLVFGDVTSDLSIPKIYYWIPLLIGFVGAAISAFAIMLAKDRGRS